MHKFHKAPMRNHAYPRFTAGQAILITLTVATLCTLLWLVLMASYN